MYGGSFITLSKIAAFAYFIAVSMIRNMLGFLTVKTTPFLLNNMQPSLHYFVNMPIYDDFILAFGVASCVVDLYCELMCFELHI